MAIIYKNERFILFDDTYLTISNKTKNYWYLIFVLAHEIGHHLLGHTVVKQIPSIQIKRQQELDADRYAGFICAKLGATYNDIRQSLQNLPEPTNILLSDHPSFANRYSSAIVGYKDNLTEDNYVLQKYNALNESDFENYKFKIFLKDALHAFQKFRITKENDDINEAKENFEKAYILIPNELVANYLSNIYGIQKDYQKIQDYQLKAYQLTRKISYLLYASTFCEYLGNCNQFKNYKELDTLNYKDLNFQDLLNYGIYLGNYNINSHSQNTQLLTKSLQVFQFAQNYIKNKNELSHENASLLREISKTEAHLGQNDSSIFHLQIPYEYFVLESKEGDGEILRLLISQYFKTQQWQSCYDIAIEFKKRYPNSSDLNSLYYLYIGAGSLNLDKTDEALKYLNEAIKLDETNVRAYYYRGLVYLRKDNIPSACTDLEIACANFIQDACIRRNIICK